MNSIRSRINSAQQRLRDAELLYNDKDYDETCRRLGAAIGNTSVAIKEIKSEQKAEETVRNEQTQLLQ